MGAEPGEDPNDPPKQGEVVYTDSRHVLCRRWNWRQDARTGISADTRRAVITVQSNGWGDLDTAVTDLMRLATEFCGASLTVAVADAQAPEVAV
jgi:DNA/RNA-binding domain of Phe-tRNA-synthetase-like protein